MFGSFVFLPKLFLLFTDGREGRKQGVVDRIMTTAMLCLEVALTFLISDSVLGSNNSLPHSLEPASGSLFFQSSVFPDRTKMQGQSFQIHTL